MAAAATGRACSPSPPICDEFDDYLAFLEPRLREAHRLLASSGTLYFHIDYREAHYCKLLLDEIFGRECFLNEIIWAYDYGARSRRRWPAKHDTILVYVKDPTALLLRRRGGGPRALHGARAGDRGEGGEGQAADRRVVAHDRAHQRPREDRLSHAEARGHRPAHDPGIDPPGDWCLDFFAGSGTLGAVAAKLGRRYVMVDCNPEAVRVIHARLKIAAEERAGAPSAPTRAHELRV